jgi:hypothetical protein
LSEKHFQDGSAELQIPPLRYASVGMTKGRVALPFRLDAVDDEQQVPPLRFAPVPRQAGTGGMTLLSGVRFEYEKFREAEGRTTDPSASLGMTKGTGTLPFRFVAVDDGQQVPPPLFLSETDKKTMAVST